MIKQITNFFKDQDSISNLETTRNLLIIGGAVSGVTVIFGSLFAQFAGAFEGYAAGNAIAAIISIILTALVVFVIDYGTKVDLPYALDLILSGAVFKDFKKNWRVLLFAFILFAFCIGRLAFTAAIDWYGRGEMIGAVMKKPQTKDVAALKLELSKELDGRLAKIQSEIAVLRREVKKTEQQVEKQNPAILVKIKKKEDKWGWYASDLQERKDKATATIRDEIAEKTTLYNQILKTENKRIDEIVASEQAQNDDLLADYKNTKLTLSNGAGFFGVGCAIGVLIVSFLLSLINSAKQDRPDYYKKHQSKHERAKAAAPGAGGPVPVRGAGERDLDLTLSLSLDRQSKLESKLRELESKLQAKSADESAETFKPKESKQDLENLDRESKSKSKTIILDLTKAKKDCRNAYNWYMRDLPKKGKNHETQLQRWARYEEAKETLTDLGFEVYANSDGLHIVAPK